MLIIADRCHICFACHFQTVHPIPVIFISISTEINSSFQWNSWFSKLRTGSIVPFQFMHMHRISHPAYHTMFMCGLFTMLCASFRWLLLRVGSGNMSFVRTRSSMFVCLLHGLILLPCGISGKMTIPSKSLLSLLASSSLFLLFLCCDTYHLFILPPILLNQSSNPPCPSKPLIGYVTALLSPSYSVVSCR